MRVTVIVWKQLRGWPVRNHSGFIFGSIGIVGVQPVLGKARLPPCRNVLLEADAHYHTAPPSKLRAE